MQRNALRHRHTEGGFTLLELLLVLVIIGVLAAVVGPEIFGAADRANAGAATTQISNYKQALERFRLDMMRVPTTEEGLAVLIKKPSTEDSVRWGGPYLKDTEIIPADPWGRQYTYKAPGENGRAYEITSLGADGQPGGEGANADILSWLAAKTNP